ncbi:MAG: MATE family efflux transporter [Lachnospiraceae bacterium]|nr:MATE family efflux transporter [Lachnospiraceae bacterium]
MIEEAKIQIFEKAPVHKAVLSQAAPAVAAQMVVLINTLADTYFIGRLNDPVLTAAVTIGSSASFIMLVISSLFGVGAASAISRALGRKDYEDCRIYSAVAFWMGFAGAVIYAVLLFLFLEPFLSLCGATGDIFEPASAYVIWLVIYGCCFGVGNPLLANLIRSEGSSAVASAGVALGALLNIVLDPLFILPGFLNRGAAGAGQATALGNALTVLIFLIYILTRKKNSVLSVSPKHLVHAKRVLPEILSIGFPSALQTALTVVAVTALAKFTSFYGPVPVAAYGIVKKLNMLPLYVVIGISNGLMPLLAYNYSAGNEPRRKGIFRFGVTISVSFAVICLIVYEIFAPSLSAVFIKDPETVSYASGFLRRVVVAQPLMAFCYPMLIQFQAMKQVKAATVCSIIRKGVLDVPLLFLMDTLIPLYGCMWVQPIVDTVSLVVELYFYRRIMKNLQLQAVDQHQSGRSSEEIPG